MSELLLTYDNRLYRFAPGTIRIGRSSESDIVVPDPTVSRRHAELSFEDPSGWVWQNAGQSPTFLNGQPVARFVATGTVDVHLASPHGPVIRLEVVPMPAQAPVRTELAAPPGLAPATHQPGPPAAAAAQAVPPAPGMAPAGPPGTPGAGPVPGAAPPGMPGYGAMPGMPGAMPGMPGAMPGYGPVPGGPPGGQLNAGSFFETLIPVKSWLHDPGWRQWLRLLIIPYALLPLIFLQIFSTAHSLSTPGWAYSIYVAPLWFIVFWYLTRPPRWHWVPEGVIAAGIVVWEWIWLHAVTININDHLASGTLNFGKALIVGYNEEISKALPVLVAALALLGVRKQKLDPRTWMLMGTIAGLTFGIIEQSLYTPGAIIMVHGAQNIPQADAGALDFAFRVFVDGFQHAVWAGVSGFFVGMAVNYRRRRVPLLLLGITIPAVLHALNDWTLTIFSTVWVTVFLVQGVSLLLFLGYTLSAATIERKVRRNPAFRGESILMDRFSSLPGGQQS